MGPWLVPWSLAPARDGPAFSHQDTRPSVSLVPSPGPRDAGWAVSDPSPAWCIPAEQWRGTLGLRDSVGLGGNARMPVSRHQHLVTPGSAVQLLWKQTWCLHCFLSHLLSGRAQGGGLRPHLPQCRRISVLALCIPAQPGL